ncbi:MAG: patatin-like phospholipase family protein [Pseudomonadota bacterium]
MSDFKSDLWGRLADRYRNEQPRRMLSLDGGGIRGLITARALVKLEGILADHTGRGPDFRLCEFFDYVGGTSTGAIIAAGIAKGMSATEILDFYREFGREVFTKRSIFKRWRSLYANGQLEKKLKQVFGESTTLRPDHLKTLLLVVTRNKTTDSAWPISSNPAAIFNNPGSHPSFPASEPSNLDFPLYKLVRASTAAPVYFPPEVIEVGADRESYVFVDGGTTPYNNPAFLMYRMATEPSYRLGWTPGESNLLIVSLGTGSAPVLGTGADDAETNLLEAATNTLSSVMSQTLVDQDMNCRTIGRCSYGAPMDLEVGDLVPRDSNGKPLPLSNDLGRQFLYARYNAELTTDWLTEHGLADIDPETVSKLDSTEGMDELERIGEKVGELIDAVHFGL